MFAFSPSTSLPLRTTTLSPSLTHSPTASPRHPRTRTTPRAPLKMWTMEDLPESLRIPERPRFGFCDYSEKLNGRLAMIGFVAAVLIELATGQGLVPKALQFLGQ